MKTPRFSTGPKKLAAIYFHYLRVFPSLPKFAQVWISLWNIENLPNNVVPVGNKGIVWCSQRLGGRGGAEGWMSSAGLLAAEI